MTIQYVDRYGYRCAACGAGRHFRVPSGHDANDRAIEDARKHHAAQSPDCPDKDKSEHLTVYVIERELGLL